MDSLWDVLEPRWARLCNELGVDVAAARRMAERLRVAHCEPHRAYHGLRHLAECFDVTDGMDDLAASDRQAVELALWFHDVVYDPRAADNEARSAAMASDWLVSIGRRDRAAEVGALIEMTAGHAQVAAGDAMVAVHDADLAILGAPPERYDEYSREVRLEYAHVADDDFAAGRARVLSGFLERDAIYVRPDVAADREIRARENMSRELASLAGSTG